jgi:hypothetical protein
MYITYTQLKKLLVPGVAAAVLACGTTAFSL